jgi:hypothetical protein
LADIEASPRALLDTMFSIWDTHGTGAFRRARRYQAGGAAGNPQQGVFLRKIAQSRANWTVNER